ncbi:hypothetical protein PENSPDRAFT_650644 [Peniophora sp. CONT]|nr:hypothetical protein PENSPDRAFT_650644 [Peniophora sp. CONT]
MPRNRNRIRPGPHPSASPRSFRFSYAYNDYEELKLKLHRQQVSNRYVDLRWLLHARRHCKAIPVNGVELDSAQDLLLFMHYVQPSRAGRDGVWVYPIQLSDAVVPSSHGMMSNAHQQAQRAAIFVEWERCDYPDRDEEAMGPPQGAVNIDVKMSLCGDHFALFYQHARNQRVVICNWKTGEKVAMVDSWRIHTSAEFPDAIHHPVDVTQFAWLARDAFMIASVVQHKRELEDALYIYRFTGNPHRPLPQVVVLELPCWRYELRDRGSGRQLGIVTGSWSEDVCPGALSYTHNRVTVLTEEFSSGPRYSIYYVLRNDILLNFFLVHHSERVLRWDQWYHPCVRLFDGPKRMEHLDIQVCGSMVLTSLWGDSSESATCVKVDDFNESRMTSGAVVQRPNWVATECMMFEDECGLWSNLEYRSVLDGRYDYQSNFILGAGRLFHTKDRHSWKRAGCVSL